MSELYKCQNCDEVFEKVFEGSSCSCDNCACSTLEKLEPKTADFKTEKHVPVVEKTANGIKVTVGSTLHPMAADHWIAMIEVIDGNKVYRAKLKPGDEPIAEFPISNENVKAYEYCNKHGLWSN
jgi:superoxide reductase